MILGRFKLKSNIDINLIRGAFKYFFRDYATNRRNADNRTILMDHYLKTIGLDCFEILNYASGFISLNKSGNEYEVCVLENVPYGDYELNSLLKLIKYGNSEIRGTNFIDKAFQYAINHI